MNPNDRGYSYPSFLKFSYSLWDEGKYDEIARICHALSSPERLAILRMLFKTDMTVSEIAKTRNLPFSSVQFHLKQLQDADLIDIIMLPGKYGMVKICKTKFAELQIFNQCDYSVFDERQRQVDIPVGMYTSCDMKFVAGFCTAKEQIMFDSGDFFDPRRADAELIWASDGYIEYSISNLTPHVTPRVMEITFEACSEIMTYRIGWKSDITVWLCGHELCTYTSPSDFGERRGRLNPAWWPDNSTQHGELIQITITEEGVYLGNLFIEGSPTTRDFADEGIFTLRIGNKPNAENKGGFNIFGKGFGDYEQDIVFKIAY